MSQPVEESAQTNLECSKSESEHQSADPPSETQNGIATNPPAPRLNPRSCVTCRRRKVRCNKENPCANCVRAGIECVFPGPGRAPRKSRKPPDAELLARLRRLEGVVHSLGAQVDENGVISPTLTRSADIRARFGDAQAGDSPSSDRSDAKRQSIDKNLGRLVISEDRSRYVSNAFWTGMSDEIAEMRDLLDPSTTDDEDALHSPETDRQMNHQAFLFGYSSTMHDLRELHPSPSQIFILWEVFKENVDPIVRILHRPTAKTILINAASSLDRVSKPAEALLFSIYFGAVVSLTPEQCQQLLVEDKQSLLKKYRFATEQALARADFLNTTSLMCLQALAFFLIFVRHCDDSRLVWALGGLALHLAQALGVHRDGTNFGLNPFDTEMRRRLWWQISLLDNRSAEDHGVDPTFTEQFYDTKVPLNLNDDDIYPGMKEYPKERTGATEMTFCLIRYELSVFSRRFNFTAPGGHGAFHDQELSLEEKERLIDECHRRLEDKYLQHCDMNMPIYWVAATVARLILAKMWLIVHHPRAYSVSDGEPSLPPEIRDRVFITSVEVIEFSHLLEKNENTAKWGWLFRTYMQWQSVAFALSEICTRPPGPDIDRAWKAIESVYDERMMSSKYQKGMLWKPLRHLMAKAKARRAAQQGQGIQFQQSLDTPFTDVPNPTPMERFMQDYPGNKGSSATDSFSMGRDQPHSRSMGLDPRARESLRANTGNAITEGCNMSQDTSSSVGINWTPENVPFGINESSIFNFGWSPSVGDFTVRGDAFQRYFANIQEEWF
ncbi:putative C6 transcription factor [Cladophialophora carrionii]|uniref:Putative C6 transcription factor n=1 Tax=Cladophialophora carrionii TaxID=86049 RepID=A0A1C1CLW5_9EURO|nr:putative C6 transcription factor [Cladophialophora carrionii]